MTDEQDGRGRPTDMPERVLEAVEELYPVEDYPGVPPERVVEYLDEPESTVYHHLDGLEAEDKLEDQWEIDRQPRRVFLPAETDEQTPE